VLWSDMVVSLATNQLGMTGCLEDSVQVSELVAHLRR
jgi:hypothetical protein